MIAAPATDWHEANQKHLMASVAVVRSRLERSVGAESAAGPSEPVDFEELPAPALDRLCEAFDLTAFERELLLLCAGVELDSRFGRLLEQTKSSTRSGNPTFGLAL